MNIVFTGEGIISAIGNNIAEVTSALREGRSGIGPMRHLTSKHKELPVGEVNLSNEEMKRMVGIDENEEISRTVLLGIIAVKEALTNANLPELAYANHPEASASNAGNATSNGVTSTTTGERRVALISGTSVGGMDITELHFKNIEQLVNLEFLKHHDCGSSTRQIANHFGIFSEISTISTACSSAANSIILGAEMLKAGEVDIVVAGGTESLTKFHLNGFNSLMILDPKPCRPFDESRAGLNLGEGAAFVVMERESDATTRGATIDGYLTGYGNACDAYHQTAFSDNGEGAYLAMREAIEMANIKSDEIQYVNAHGTGTANNDLCEAVALHRIFGEKMPEVSSTKSFTGHTTSAAGGIEAVISLIALNNDLIPANLGFSKPFEGGIVASKGMSGVKLENILCNSFGFGGNDSALLISRRPTAPASAENATTSASANPATNSAENPARTAPTESAPTTAEPTIRILAQREIDSMEQLEEIRKWVKPLEARRMGKLMKGAIITAMQVLEDAGIEKPDAIIMGTRYGCLENSENLLMQMINEDEALLSPTYFMQSTHNTISSSVAIKLQCHGYNVTYTQGEESLDWALRDAKRLLRSGRYKTILVGYHDETTDLFQSLFHKIGVTNIPKIHSISILLSCGR